MRNSQTVQSVQCKMLLFLSLYILLLIQGCILVKGSRQVIQLTHLKDFEH